MEKKSFDYLVANSSLLIAESTNTYQHRLSEGRPFIHGFSKSFSISKLKDGVLSPAARDFETKYLSAQSLFESQHILDLSNSNLIKNVLTEIFQKSSGSEEYFTKLSEEIVKSRPDKVGTLLLKLHDKDFSVPAQGDYHAVQSNPDLLRAIDEKLNDIKNDPNFAPPGMGNDQHFQYQKDNLKAVDIYLAIQTGKFNKSFWSSLRQVITQHLDISSDLG